MTVVAEKAEKINSAKDIVIAKKSLKRCLTKPEFLDIFYEKFLGSSDEIKAKFINTRFPNQKIMLKASLHIMVMLAQGSLKDTEQLQNLADKHSKGKLNIHPEFYQLWLDSMLYAVKVVDPEYSDVIFQAWKVTLQPGIDFFTSKY